MQGSNQIDYALRLKGKTGFWGNVAKKMSGGRTAQNIQIELNEILKRLNQITHEVDIERTIRNRKTKFQEIDKSEAEKAVKFIKDFVATTDKIFYP